MKESEKIKFKAEMYGVGATFIAYLFLSGGEYDWPGQLGESFLGSDIFGWIIVGLLVVGSMSSEALKEAAHKKQIDKE